MLVLERYGGEDILMTSGPGHGLDTMGPRAPDQGPNLVLVLDEGNEGGELLVSWLLHSSVSGSLSL